MVAHEHACADAMTFTHVFPHQQMGRINRSRSRRTEGRHRNVLRPPRRSRVGPHPPRITRSIRLDSISRPGCVAFIVVPVRVGAGVASRHPRPCVRHARAQHPRAKVSNVGRQKLRKLQFVREAAAHTSVLPAAPAVCIRIRAWSRTPGRAHRIRNTSCIRLVILTGHRASHVAMDAPLLSPSLPLALGLHDPGFDRHIAAITKRKHASVG